MITLYGSAPAYGLPDLSPFVAKVATYCRLAGIEYTLSTSDSRKAPKRKIPFLDDGGEVIADSSAIVAHLRRKYRDLDEGLDARDRAVASAFKSMFEEHTYFCSMYLRWIDPRGWALQEPTFKAFLTKTAGVPGLIAGLLLRSIRRKVGQTLDGQGTGRHSLAEVEAIAKGHLDAASEWLGDNAFFMGDAPRSVDATVWAFLASTQGFPSDNAVRAHLNTKPNLVAYVERIRNTYWK